MRKNFLKTMVIAVVAATTIGGFSSLEVSAATFDSNTKDYYKEISNNLLKTGWVINNGNWYYFDNSGIMQTGVIKVNDKTYCLNPSGIMETGKITVNNKVYATNSSGQVTGTKAPVIDKAFDSANKVVKDNNKNSTVSNSNSNQKTTANTVNTANSGNSKIIDNASNTTNTKTPQSTGSTTSVDVQGLAKLPTNYSITVQASAEQKILELMNAKRTEAGLNPLTMDNTLVQVARYKSNDMIQNNFFDHTNPDGTKWTNWLQTIGYKYTSTGENIAYNTSDPVELFNQWWNSPGHRANMMNSSYNKVGMGVLYGNGKYMGTQTFSN